MEQVLEDSTFDFSLLGAPGMAGSKENTEEESMSILAVQSFYFDFSLFTSGSAWTGPTLSMVTIETPLARSL